MIFVKHRIKTIMSMAQCGVHALWKETKNAVKKSFIEQAVVLLEAYD